MARKIISTTVKTKAAAPVSVKSDILAIGVFSDEGKPGKLAGEINKNLKGAVKKLLALGDFKAKCGSTAVIYTDGKIAPARVLLVGLGDRKELTADCIRKASSIAANKAVSLKAANITVALNQQLPAKISDETIGQAITEGLYFGSYRYDEFVSKSKDNRLDSLKCTIVDEAPEKIKAMGKGVKAGTIIGKAQTYARTIANRPGNIINPPALAAEARKVAKADPSLSCKIFDEKALIQMQAGGILAVGAGSASQPRMIVLKYTPKGAAARAKKPIALVGKAITFDSGGISIKPSAGMEEMKFDKSGGIAVLGAMKAIAALKPAQTVYGIIPSAENMPDGTASRPGDIITTMSGKTVEIKNTDAEGRLILCDAIHYATKQKCEAIVDIATLTGACVVALGKYMAGLMGNNDQLIEQLKDAAKSSGEKVWHLPCTDEYSDDLKSGIADICNIGNSRWGGAITAGAFLKSFVGETNWAHIDMAGMDMFAGKEHGSEGAPGFGVRLLTEFAINYK
ncbi:MAG: leucyl aminopeptidase [Phycisphaerae bacterium]|nr:leucyl aminopeptidase [Phycisphaerae bacterium]